MHIRRTGEERQTPGEKTAHKATDVSPFPSPWRKFSPLPVEASGARSRRGPRTYRTRYLGRGGGLGAVRESWPGHAYAAFEPES